MVVLLPVEGRIGSRYLALSSAMRSTLGLGLGVIDLPENGEPQRQQASAGLATQASAGLATHTGHTGLGYR